MVEGAGRAVAVGMQSRREWTFGNWGVYGHGS